MILLKEDACGVLDVQFGNEVVASREDQPVVVVGLRGERFVVGPQADFGDVIETLDVVTELSQVVDRRPLDVLVRENSIRH